MNKGILICLVIAVVILVVVFSVSLAFFVMVLKGRKDRKDRVKTPLKCEHKNGDTQLRRQFIENRIRLREEGAEFDKTMTEVDITNSAGMKLCGRYRLQPNECHNWIISVHGFKDDHRFMLPYVKAFYEHGYNVFTQDNRAHGLSDGKYISMGWHDKDDVFEWLNYIVSIDSEAKIVVHGISMGGATTMMLSGLNHPAVVGYVEDCGYTSVWDIFETVINRDYNLPAFPILYVSRLLANIFLKYDYKKASSLMQLEKCNNVPILFIHGEKDDFVPLWMGQRCYDKYDGPKDIYIAPEAGHAESMDYYPETYFEKVYKFVDEEFQR